MTTKKLYTVIIFSENTVGLLKPDYDNFSCSAVVH